MSNTIPGSYLTSNTSDEEDENDQTLAELLEETETTDMDEDDSDFAPNSGDEILIDEDDEEDEEDEAPGGGGDVDTRLSIAFDPNLANATALVLGTRQILIVGANGQASRLTSEHLRGTALTLASIRRMMVERFGGGAGLGESDEEDDEEEEEGAYWGGNKKSYYDVVTSPVEAGVNLERSGLFGSPPKKYMASQRKLVDYSTNLASTFRLREYDYRRSPKSSIGHFTVPNSSGTEVSQFQSKVYSGQYSADGSFFYSACQDFNVYIADTRTPPLCGNKSVMDNSAPSRGRRGMGTYWEHRSSLKTLKVLKMDQRNARWCITDAHLSNDSELLVYSSITPRVNLAKTGAGAEFEGPDQDQITLDFAAGVRGSPSFGIWSVRFSNDAKEVVAGANDGQIFIYDIEAGRTILRVNAHRDDVNAVAIADTASSNILISGSDDSFIKVWDRRSLSGERPSGTLVGATEGITFVASKGDGRYCLSNSKDQATKLWDLRMMMDSETFDKFKLDRVDYGIPGWDYRSFYTKPRYKEHPHDNSVMTYRGASILRTLIRCHFSPIATTDQRYVYSGSTDGKIHIWSLDGQIVEVIDRRNTHPLINAETGDYNDPAAVDLRNTVASVRGRIGSTVRDVSMHPFQPLLMSSAWEERGGIQGSIALHMWKGQKGETLEDQAARRVQESST